MVFVWLVLFVVVGTTIITYLKRAAARARERAGLPPRAQVKLPLYWWVLSFLLLGINAVFVFSPHIAGSSWFLAVINTAAVVILARRLIMRRSPLDDENITSS
jgi:protein-S-isoprenylcysteine O-methyltransferase Ste14